MRPPRPARPLRALLRVALPGDVRDEVAADVDELFRRRAERRGTLSAHLWYVRQPFAFALRFLPERVRRGGSSPTPSRAPHGGRGPRATWGWRLDLKLALRMAMRHPGLSLVSTAGLAVAVTIGTAGFGALHTLVSSSLPLDEGDRIVTVQNTEGGFGQMRSTHLHDLESWRENVRAISAWGAYRIARRNLITEDGQVTPTRVVEMTASGFEIARVPPLLGRPLLASDESEGAVPVVVLGHGIWQDRYGASPDVLGRTLRIGTTPHVVVGVMPEGFAFPINNRVWTPLRLDPADFERGAAPEIDVFGRLAPGATVEEASAQIEALGIRAAALFPETHETLHPRIFPYAQELVWGPTAWLIRVGQAALALVLVVIAINVAVLFYARTVSRTKELVVRSALGASRMRIASQLFLEALVLSGTAAALGLFAARDILARIGASVQGSGGEQIPFWWSFSLTPAAALYAFGLAVLAALIMGVVPALRTTGRALRSGLPTLGSGGEEVRLGRVWTALIVAQVAGAVAVLPMALNLGVQHLGAGMSGQPYPLDDFVTASLRFEAPAVLESGDEAAEPLGPRYAAAQEQLLQRLMGSGAVSHVVVMRPAPWEDPDLRIEVEGQTEPVPDPDEFHLPTTDAGWSRVGPGFLEAFEVPVVAGRAFEAGDGVDGEAVLVSETFVNRVLGGGEAVGRRIRPSNNAGEWGIEAAGPWHTIIGVVPDFPAPSGPLPPEPKVYQSFVPDPSLPLSIAVRVRSGEADAFAARVRQLAAEVDPDLHVEELLVLGRALENGASSAGLFTTGIVSIALAVLLLSVAGLHALVSFTIVRRRREIGIRSALGARPQRILAGVLRRTLIQVTVGVGVGLFVANLLDGFLGGDLMGGREIYLLPGVALLMAVVALIATWSPAREGLRVSPTEALRSE